MFGTSKKTLHTSILINDQVIRYVVMHMDNQGMYVVHHDEAHLPKGVVVVGEVLKARILGDILSMIHKKIVSVLKEKKIRARNEYSVLLPHEHFYHTQFEVKGIAESNDSSKMLKQYLSENIDQFPWAQRYSYVHVLDGDVVHVEALPSDVYQSYTLLFKNAGFSSVKVVSDIARLGSLVEYHSTSLIVMIDEHQTKIVDYTHGVYEQEQRFDFSYQTLVNDIVKHLKVEKEFAKKVVHKYGVSRKHPDEEVYQRIIRSTMDIVDTLRKKRGIKKIPVYVWYLNMPLVGMDDVFAKRLGVGINILDPLGYDRFTTHEVLEIHQDDIHRYGQVILESLGQLSR